jgi:hypothetical protein
LGGLLLLQPADFLLPLLLAAPLMFIQLVYETRSQARELLPEVAGAVALGSAATGVVMLAGWQLTPALLLWGLLTARTLPAILYVRARLRLERGKTVSPLPTLITHGIALGAALGLILGDHTGSLAGIALLLLLGRAAWGLSPYRTPAKRPAIIGFQEMAWGLLSAILFGLAAKP